MRCQIFSTVWMFCFELRVLKIDHILAHFTINLLPLSPMVKTIANAYQSTNTTR